MSMLRVSWLSSLVALTMSAPALLAQEAAPALPKQARIVTASVGGTGPDFIARLMAPKFSEGLKINMIVENRPSVNGIVAAQYSAKAPADGSVMMMGNAGTHAINAALYKKLPSDVTAHFLDDLAEAAGTGRAPAELAQREWMTWDMIRAMGGLA